MEQYVWHNCSKEIISEIKTNYEKQSKHSKRLNYEEDIFFFPNIQESIPLFENTCITFQPNEEINKKIIFWKGDITDLNVDAITNAARTSLLGGGGIDGRIHKVAGPELKEYCSNLGPVNYGEVRISPSFGNLKCNWVIHGVGPRSELVKEEERRKLLKMVYENSLAYIRTSHGLNNHRLHCPLVNQPNIKNELESKPIKSVSICCYSVGAFRCPLRDSTHIALHTIRKWMDENVQLVDFIVINVFTKWEFETYSELLPVYFPIE